MFDSCLFFHWDRSNRSCFRRISDRRTSGTVGKYCKTSSWSCRVVFPPFHWQRVAAVKGVFSKIKGWTFDFVCVCVLFLWMHKFLLIISIIKGQFSWKWTFEGMKNTWDVRRMTTFRRRRFLGKTLTASEIHAKISFVASFFVISTTAKTEKINNVVPIISRV